MSLAQAEAAELRLEQGASLWSDAFDRFRHNLGAIVGVALILIFVVIAIFAPVIAPFDPNEQVGPLATNPEGPGNGHLFGLDCLLYTSPSPRD